MDVRLANNITVKRNERWVTAGQRAISQSNLDLPQASIFNFSVQGQSGKFYWFLWVGCEYTLIRLITACWFVHWHPCDWGNHSYGSAGMWNVEPFDPRMICHELPSAKSIDFCLFAITLLVFSISGPREFNWLTGQVDGRSSKMSPSYTKKKCGTNSLLGSLFPVHCS